MLTTLFFIFNLVVAYLVGSVCSAVLISKLCDLPDPRLAGSKNPGATNVLRLAGKKYASLVLLADMLKGFVPVAFASLLGAGPIVLGFTCLAAVIGHMYPLFFNFKGGKGVATAIGALLGFHFLLGVSVIATWLIVAKISRYSSLAAIISIALAPFFSLFAVGGIHAFPPLMCIAILVIYKHIDNISRLIDGSESKIHFNRKAPLGDTINEAFLNDSTETLKKKPASATRTKKSTIKAKTATKAKAKKTDETAKKSVKTKTTKKAVKTEKKPAKAAVKKAVKTEKKPAKTVKKDKAK